MSDTLRDRIARALYDECCQQDAYVDTAHGKYIPDPTDPEDWITVDGRLRFAELADAAIAAFHTTTADTRALAIGSCIALIEHTTALAQAAESPHNAAVIAEWSNKITTAIRMAAADITGGSK